MNNNGKGMAVASLICGILSIVFYWAPFINIIALVLGIVGLVTASKGKTGLKAAGMPTGMATAGLVLSIIGVVFSGIGVFTCTICTSCVACGASGAANELAALGMYY